MLSFYDMPAYQKWLTSTLISLMGLAENEPITFTLGHFIWRRKYNIKVWNTNDGRPNLEIYRTYTGSYSNNELVNLTDKDVRMDIIRGMLG